MLTFSLQSGSNGNAIYVETPDARLLLDAGISGKQAELRMARHGRDIRDCDALLISHDHSDHVRCAGVYHRKFGLPVLMTPTTWRAAKPFLGTMPAPTLFRPGQVLTFGKTRVETIPTPHDSADSTAFVITHGGQRLGVLTDLGHVFDGLGDLIAGLDAAYLEANYDPDMLWNGPYPWGLKQRVSGEGGHLSNDESADLAATFGRRLRWLAVAHLSEQNNRPQLARNAIGSRVDGGTAIVWASRYDVSDCWEV
jgi:phosphoribosyl 1,2-cyclic phosphodiesterase